VHSGPSPEHLANAMKIGIAELKPAEDLAFIFINNTLYCGTMEFNLAIDMEEAGVRLANHHQSIFAIPHLYKARRQTSIVEMRWPMMENAIELEIGESLPEIFRQHQRTPILGISAWHFG